MSPYFHFLVTVGTWAQTHAEFVLAVSGTVVLLLGLARLTWRSSVPHGRLKR